MDLAKQLPKKERIKFAPILAQENDSFLPKEILKTKIAEDLKDAKLHKEDKIKLRTLKYFLSNV